ncbi:MAG: efflux transporter outer membrane subunit [Betaproteobacteria bacterium]|nr:efflux transporter outer membrane subunit [Betaproteobacteria bacterium]MDE2622496.1 efflux transporter outer membrane subunit [Betaproteobacteria bacterium]
MSRHSLLRMLPALLLAGCALGPDFKAPAAPDSERYLAQQDPSSTAAADGRAQHFERSAKPEAQWWRAFGSSPLDALVTQGLARNASLEAAQASLRQSARALQAGYGVFYPQVSAGAGASREKFSPALFGSTSPGPTFNLFTLSASVGYALDVFGGARRTVEGLAAQQDVQQAQLEGSTLALAGNLVNTAIAQAAYGAELEQTQALVLLLRQQLTLAQFQTQAGTVPYSAVLALQAQLAQAEATVPPLQQAADQAQHLLATLSGTLPSRWQMPPLAFDSLKLPEHLPLSLPSELVRQRPDIRAAEATLHAASAAVGVATAAQFPSFTLSGAYGQYSTSTGTLLAGGGNFWNLGVDVAAPLFDGGTLRARRQAAEETYAQSAALYRQTVLNAFAQVADVLRALEHDAQTLQAALQAQAAVETAARLLEANEQAGIANGLQVLTAQVQLRQANLAVLQARALRLQDTTAYYLALGQGSSRQAGP